MTEEQQFIKDIIPFLEAYCRENPEWWFKANKKQDPHGSAELLKRAKKFNAAIGDTERN